MFVCNERVDSIAGQAILAVEDMLTITSPLHKAVFGCCQDRTVRFCQYLYNLSICVLKGKDLQLAIPIPGQATFTQSQPEATFGIARQRNWIQPLVCNFGGESAILNLDQSLCISGPSANDYGPNAAIHILGDPQDDPMESPSRRWMGLNLPRS